MSGEKDVADIQLERMDAAIDLIEKSIKECKVAGAKAKMFRTMRELLAQRRELIDTYNFNVGLDNQCDHCRHDKINHCGKPASFFIPWCGNFEEPEEEAEESEQEGKAV